MMGMIGMMDYDPIPPHAIPSIPRHSERSEESSLF